MVFQALFLLLAFEAVNGEPSYSESEIEVFVETGGLASADVSSVESDEVEIKLNTFV